VHAEGPEELVVTFIDVDGLKALTTRWVTLPETCLLIAASLILYERVLRSYDLIMRFGGRWQFVCALPKINVQDVRRRLCGRIQRPWRRVQPEARSRSALRRSASGDSGRGPHPPLRMRICWLIVRARDYL